MHRNLSLRFSKFYDVRIRASGGAREESLLLKLVVLLQTPEQGMLSQPIDAFRSPVHVLIFPLLDRCVDRLFALLIADNQTPLRVDDMLLEGEVYGVPHALTCYRRG